MISLLKNSAPSAPSRPSCSVITEYRSAFKPELNRTLMSTSTSIGDVGALLGQQSILPDHRPSVDNSTVFEESIYVNFDQSYSNL
jgi:hypothetical protein